MHIQNNTFFITPTYSYTNDGLYAVRNCVKALNINYYDHVRLNEPAENNSV